MTRAEAQQRADQLIARLDANHVGMLDQAVRDARQKIRFDRLDSNHDGEVSYAEFTAARSRFDQARDEHRSEHGGRAGGHRLAGRGLGAIFRAEGGGLAQMADANKDGVVTKAEFEAAALERFERLDANKDGVVTPDEAKAARDNLRQQWQSRREARDS